MNALKMLVAVALLVGGITAAANEQDNAPQPAAGRSDDKRSVDRWRYGDEKQIEKRKARSAPEIDGRSAVSALALLSSLLLLFRRDHLPPR